MHMNKFVMAMMQNAISSETDEDDKGLNERQNAMYEMYEKIAEKFGKWDTGIGADGAHYVERSPFASEGMICLNCVYFQGGGRCEIVKGEIATNAICKLWIISDKLLNDKNQ
jgi:hypothetical protein